MDTYNEVLKALPKLRSDQLDEVVKRIGALKALGSDGAPAEDTKVDSDVDWVLNILADVMRKTGTEYPSTKLLKKSAQFSTFKQKVPDVMAYVRQASPTRVNQYAILQLGIDLLNRYLIKRGGPVGSRMLMQNIHRVPDVLNQQFPGYAISGMLHKIIRRDTDDGNLPRQEHQSKLLQGRAS